MNIVFFHHYAGCPQMGMSYRVYYLAREWVKAGHKVTIVAGSYSHIRRVNKKLKRWKEEEMIDDIRYIWLKTSEYEGNGVKRIISMMQFVHGLYRLIPLLKKDGVDAVIAGSTYPLDNYPAYKLSKKANAKYIYEVRDLWPLSPMKLGGYSKYHPFIVVMQIAENFAYRHVDEIVTVLPCAESYMKEHGLLPGKYHYVPNGIYLPEVSCPEPLPEEILAKLPKDKKLVGYCGTFGTANALHLLVETARLTQDSDPDIFYVLVGKGPEKEHLVNLIQSYNLHNILIIDAIPKAQVQSMLQAFIIIIIIIWNNIDIYKYGISPNKIFDYMYSGKPVIQAVEAGNDIPKEAGCGFSCASTPEAIRDTIKKMLAFSVEDLEQMGQNGKHYVITHHNYSYLAQSFLSVLGNSESSPLC